ncbi:endolytic transglycosylase MltG [Kineococcus sp. SYSU DK004]|uniref:endolytic transglycosylase MltG n=1 Tax=Kineococcus sp. SYSU DK004 TaxID=3383125 RepID=UPI003D7D4274
MDLTDLPGSQQPDAAGRRRRRVRRRRTAVAVVVSLAVLGGGTAAAWSTLEPVVSGFLESDDFEGEGTGEVDVRVMAGDSGTAIGRTLQEAGVVKTTTAFVSAASAQPDMATIQPGTYRLREGMSAASAVALLLDPASRVTTRLTVPEGRTAAQVLDLISSETPIDRAQLDAALADPAALGLPASAQGNVEGYLFPATYEVNPDETAAELLGQMVGQTVRVLAELGVPAEREREVVTTASIVEREVQTPQDMSRAARVIANRLADGMPLQMDSTVAYANRDWATTTTTAEQRAIDSPYNTYRYPGLPAGPISNPGADALRAALDPEPGPWLFFVTVNLDTGETRFAATEQEHFANVELFRAWLRENPE